MCDDEIEEEFRTKDQQDYPVLSNNDVLLHCYKEKFNDNKMYGMYKAA